jgi:hypothetical protein
MRFSALLLFIFAVSTSTALTQQDSTHSLKVYRLTLHDGSDIIGTIVKQDTLAVEFQTISKISMLVPRSQIATMTLLSGYNVDSEYRRSDPNSSRLFFSPTGRALKNGQGYFSAYEIFFPSIAVGIGDVVSLSGGISLLPGVENQIFYFAPKVTPVHVQNFDLSGGILFAHGTGSTSFGGGVIYGVGTYGSEDNSLTMGLGWGFSGGDVANKPIVILGGEIRLTHSIKLISENWIPPWTDIIIYSFGLRFHGENLAADLGFIRTSAGMETSGFPYIPWIGFTYNFGAR